MIENKLIQLAKECPNVMISISASDLVTANEILIADCKKEMEQSIKESKSVTYLTSEKVMEMLSVAPSTLWRWQKSGYLTPILVGGQKRYKSSDINKILEQ